MAFPRAVVALIGASAASAQLLSMSVCTDGGCNTGCVSWTTAAGSCAVCQASKGACSFFNPSSVTTLAGITFYSDAACRTATTGQQPLTFDGRCHPLSAGGGSYTALNASAIIGGVVGGIFGLIVILVAVIFCCRARGVPCCACCCGFPGQSAGCCGRGCGVVYRGSISHSADAPPPQTMQQPAQLPFAFPVAYVPAYGIPVQQQQQQPPPPQPAYPVAGVYRM